MIWQTWLCMGLIPLVLGGLVLNIAPDAILLGALTVLMLTGVVSPSEAFAGFSNTGMLTVAALYVVTAGLRETGALDALGARVLGRARTSKSVLYRMALPVTAMSAFLNNTPIVAMFIPIITNWCRKHQTAPSRLLLPLSYLCILGGTCTLIGTSTNLVVNGLMTEMAASTPTLEGSLRPMGLFELSWVGVPYAIIGTLYLFFIGSRLLPDRKDMFASFSASSRDYLVNLCVGVGCRLIGKKVEEAGLRHLPGLFLIEIRRGAEVITPVPPDQTLREGDELAFTGAVDTIVDLVKIPGLDPITSDDSAVEDRSGMLCEAVVSARAPFLGKTIRDAEFRAAYNAVVIAVHRGAERLKGKVGDIVLRSGDTLLLQTGPHFARAQRGNPHFLLVGGVEDSRPVRSDKAIVALLLLVLLIGLMTTGVISIVSAAFLTASLMIATRCISIADARQNIDWQTLITIAAAFGLGKALDNVGLVAMGARLTVDIFGGFGPVAVLAGLYLFTSLCTEIITNNAAAALIFPFAVGIGVQMGVDPRPLVMAVTFAASASLMTPLGYQTNLMVYGPGGYHFTDYVRVGLPLNLILLAAATLLIPLAWPF